MDIKTIPVGYLQTNCYLVENGGLAAVVDPGGEASMLRAAVEASGAELRYLLLTHGHDDHTGAVAALHALYPEAEVYIHREDYEHPAAEDFPLRGEFAEVKFYDEGDELPLGDLSFHVLHTPGHSAGSVTLRIGDALLCGDTLFAGSCGRTDFPGGDPQAMLQSLKRLAQLPGDFRVLPGHMESSTLERERQRNPYVSYALRSGRL